MIQIGCIGWNMAKRLFEAIVETIDLDDIRNAQILAIYSDNVDFGELEQLMDKLCTQLDGLTEVPMLVSLPVGSKIDTLSDDDLEELGLMRDLTHKRWETAEVEDKEVALKVLAAKRRKSSVW